MEYGGWIEQVMKLPFVNDTEAADAAIKGVLGTLGTVVDEDQARRLTERFPPELDFMVLRGHQGVLHLTQEQFVSSVARHFHLSFVEALKLVERVLSCVKETEEGAEVVEEIRWRLPQDWRELVGRA